MARPLHRIPEPEVMSDRQEAAAYDEADFRRVNGAFARRLVREIPRRRGVAVDLGTGPAEIPILFCGLVPGWRVTAVDRSAAMLRLARQRVERAGLSDRIRLLRADAKRVSRDGRGFDLVFSNSLLHHLPDPVPFWRQVARLAAPSGRIVVMDLRRPPTRSTARDLVRRHAAGATPLLRQLFHQSLLAAFTPAEVRAQLSEAGLAGLTTRATTDRHLVVSGRLLA